MAIPVLLHLVLAASALVQPESFPARGAHEALLTLGHPGMVHLSAEGKSGTSCTVVDQLRGPFSSSGTPGRVGCSTDLLLDAGVYKVRLTSPRRGKGKVALHAVPFPELNAAPIRLEPGRSLEQPLHPGQQASYWIHLDRRELVVLRASGRTAGKVVIWRAGTWREELPARDAAPSPLNGQPIHEWWLSGLLDPGDYLITAYGTDPLRWTQGTESDQLSVQFGLPSPADRAASLVLPASGMAAFSLPPGPATAVLGVGARLPAYAWLTILNDALATSGPTCQIQPNALDPQCVVLGTGQGNGSSVLVVRGVPGAPVELRWPARHDGQRLVDGEYREPSNAVALESLPAGEYLLGLHDLPADPDAAPLGCALVRERPNGAREAIAFDFPRVGKDRPLRRPFNYRDEQQIWFEVTDAGTYQVSTSGESKSRCELYFAGGDTPKRLTETSPEPVCNLRRTLSPGRYYATLVGGTEGVERIFVGLASEAAKGPDSPPRTGCALRTRLESDGRYLIAANRLGAVAARGLVARPLPLALSAPLPIEIPAGETVRLPLERAGAVRVRTFGGRPATCALARGGPGSWREEACWVDPQGPDELVLSAGPAAPLLASVERVTPPAPLPPLQAWSPKLAPPPALQLNAPAFFDFAPEQSHSVRFEVTQAGLYQIGTEGLLQTACALRTPTIPELLTDEGSGRGRNCQVSAFLRPGTYLFTARTGQRSRGRASILLTRRPVQELPRVKADGEAFFRVDAGVLIQRPIEVTRRGRHQLSTAAQGAQLQCRLDDRAGWPLVPVPAPCQQTLELPAGKYLWTELPLGVESMRHLSATRVRPPELLRGKAPHPIALWQRHPVVMSASGKDTFLFSLDADLELFVELTHGVQGRITREGEEQPIAIVAPQGAGASDTAAPADGAEASTNGDGESATRQPEAEAESEPAQPQEEAAAPPPAEEPARACEEGDCNENSEPSPAAEPQPAAARQRVAQPSAVPATPPGQRVLLSAGRYRLVTEQSRGDVGVRYWIQLASPVLTPGVKRALPVPGRVPLRMARAATLRLRTRGDLDVRCRILDGSGREVAGSSSVGDDWNCALAEPLAAGDYTLVIESETLTEGSTQVELSAPVATEGGPLQDGGRYALGDGILSLDLAPPQGDAVLQISFESKDPFSCAVEGVEPGDTVAGGSVLQTQLDARQCRMLLHPGRSGHRVRLWTLERPAQVQAHLTVKPVRPIDGKRLPAGSAALAEIPLAGRYRTGEGILCAPAAGAALLRSCDPEVSLEPGPTLFATFGEGAALPLDELTTALDAPRSDPVRLDRRPLLERQRSGRRAIHLVEVRVAPGEGTLPWCELEGGVRAAGELSCFAASSSTTLSTLRVFAPADAPIDAQLLRLAIPLPSPSARLAPGRQELRLGEGGAALYALPPGPARVELILPPAAWAIALRGDAAVDLCPPAGDLSRCLLATTGGELLVYAPEERHAVIDLTSLPAPPAELTLAGGLYEARFPLPGTAVLRVPARGSERRLEVEGASHCRIQLSDGSRLAECAAPLPAEVRAEVVFEHAVGAVRVLARAPDEAEAAHFGQPLTAQRPPPVSPISEGEGVALHGDRVDRALTLDHEALVHLRSDAGVCALASGGAVLAAGGLGAGCALDRLLPAGTHRVLVRAFASEPLTGAVRFTREPVEPLAEGAGAERWVEPGGSRLFRFQLASRGRVGVGLQANADVLTCAVLDASQRIVATGCQAMAELDAGSYLLMVKSPPAAPAMRFRPVLLGLSGADRSVPEDYLRDLFQRIGETP